MYIIREPLKMEHKGVLENKLREFRFNRDQITQEELANALGVSRQTILAIYYGSATMVNGHRLGDQWHLLTIFSFLFWQGVVGLILSCKRS